MVALTLLHVGLHKTASTSFQVTCGKNRKWLEARGFCYPRLFNQEGGVETENHSIALYNIFSRSRAEYIPNTGKRISMIENDLRVYRRLLLLELFKKGSLILSGEDVSDLGVGEQESLAVYLSSFSHLLKTFAVVRSPYSLHCSAFAGMIASGRALKPTSFLSQLGKIKKLRASFCRRGNIAAIQFIPFMTTLKATQGPARSLLELMGFNDLDGLSSEVKNEGLSNEQTRNQLSLNLENPRVVGGKINPLWQRAAKAKGSKFLLTQREFDLIMPNILEENKWFEENLGKEFCDTSFPTCD